MSIEFEVVDLSCESAEAAFFVPIVTLSAKSTTKYATVYGFSEFGTPSSPPKKYRMATVTGTSERIGFTAEQTPRQCAGAKYVWSGSAEYDFKGNLIQRYSKNFYAQCAKQFWPNETLQVLPGAITTGGAFPTMVGFCWPDWSNSCAVCDPDETNWSLLGDKAVQNLTVDLSGFVHNPADVVQTKTSWALNDVFHGITSIAIDTNYTAVLGGTSSSNYTVTVGTTNYTGRAAVTDPPTLEFPAVFLDGGDGFTVGNYVNWTDTNNYSATLSEEYTDADALANATIVVGTSTTAQNSPRTTGFTGVFTDVVFTLNCTNLVKDRTYLVNVEFWTNPGGTKVTKQYGFISTGTIHTITDSIPQPPSGKTTTVRSPTIAFA